MSAICVVHLSHYPTNHLSHSTRREKQIWFVQKCSCEGISTLFLVVSLQEASKILMHNVWYVWWFLPILFVAKPLYGTEGVV